MLYRDWRLSQNPKNVLFVILNEVKNLINTGCYKFEILRLTPQNDILGHPDGFIYSGARNRPYFLVNSNVISNVTC